nr:15691_t:CDS:2 [Entrophospora candida]
MPYLKTLSKLENIDMNTWNLICIQLLEAVSFMHDLNIDHLDLKADNTVFDPQTKQIFIIGFGHAKK